MKKLIVSFLFVAFFGVTIQAQTTKLQFEYDVAGNQISRKLCINCITTSNKEYPKTIEEVQEEDYLKFTPQDVISYYPNPVQEILFLKWDLINNNQVEKIEIYSITGQFTSSIKNLSQTSQIEIPFQNYPIGNYLVILHFANQDQKTIKITKQ